MQNEGDLAKKLSRALLEAFPTRADLRRLILFELNKNLNEIAGDGPLSDVVLEIIEWALRTDQVSDLINGAIIQNSSNKKLQDLKQEFGHSKYVPDLSHKRPPKGSFTNKRRKIDAFIREHQLKGNEINARSESLPLETVISLKEEKIISSKPLQYDCNSPYDDKELTRILKDNGMVIAKYGLCEGRRQAYLNTNSSDAIAVFELWVAGTKIPYKHNILVLRASVKELIKRPGDAITIDVVYENDEICLMAGEFSLIFRASKVEPQHTNYMKQPSTSFSALTLELMRIYKL